MFFLFLVVIAATVVKIANHIGKKQANKQKQKNQFFCMKKERIKFQNISISIDKNFFFVATFAYLSSHSQSEVYILNSATDVYSGEKRFIFFQFTFLHSFIQNFLFCLFTSIMIIWFQQTIFQYFNDDMVVCFAYLLIIFSPFFFCLPHTLLLPRSFFQWKMIFFRSTFSYLYNNSPWTIDDDGKKI